MGVAGTRHAPSERARISATSPSAPSGVRLCVAWAARETATLSTFRTTGSRVGGRCPRPVPHVTLGPMLTLIILAILAMGIMRLLGGMFITPEWD